MEQEAVATILLETKPNWVSLLWQSLRRWNDRLAKAGLVYAALIPLLLIGLVLDDRVVLGLNPWIKPLKFSASALIYTWTLAWMMGQLQIESFRKEKLAKILSVTLFVEIALIVMQSSRGTASHFNQGSIFNQMVFSAMGILILANTLVVVRLERLFAKQMKAGRGEMAINLGIRLGIWLFLFGCFVTGFMLRANAHTVGASDGGPGLPLLNWSINHGDLRIAHFIGLHGLQIVPAVAWLTRNKPQSRRWTMASAVLVLTLVLAALGQALMGLPLIAL